MSTAPIAAYAAPTRQRRPTSPSTTGVHHHTAVTRAHAPGTEHQENTVYTAHLSHELARERCRELLDQATRDRLAGLALATRTRPDRLVRSHWLPRIRGRRSRPARGPVPTG